MDERRGGWGRLLALFRLVHTGDGTGWIRNRGGKLFDPAAFPFLEGRDGLDDPPAPAPVTDGCILRVLDGLQTDELCPCNWKKGEETLTEKAKKAL